MREITFATFLLSALVSASTFATGSAHAQTFWRTMSPFYCSVFNRDFQWGLASPYNYTVANLSSNTDMYISCGVPNDNNLRHHTSGDAGYTARIYLVGTTTGSGITNASACVSYYSTTGGSCGNQTNITTNPFGVELDSSSGAGSWANTLDQDMPFVYMVLKPCTGSPSCSAFNTLRGYKVTQ